MAATWWTRRDEPKEAPRVYAALGASDTVGVGATRPATEGWAPRVHAGLPEGTQFVNLGISGATLGDIVREELPPALDARPQLVTLWTGVNDLRAGVPLETFTRQLDAVLAAFARPQGRAESHPTVVVLNSPDLALLPVFASLDEAALDATVQTWNAAIAASAARHGAILVDLHAEWRELAQHPEYISADGFHPSSTGYRRIAELVLAALDKHVATTAR